MVALSSAEAEFLGIAKGITKVLWIKKLITEIGFPPQLPSQLKYDNKAAISISENPVQYDRSSTLKWTDTSSRKRLRIVVLSFHL